MNLILDTIDKMNVVSGLGILSALAGDESGQQWDEISNYLFQILGKINKQLLWDISRLDEVHPCTIDRLILFIFILTAAIIRGNHTNCSQFAQAQRLNWLFSKLGGEGAGMMDVLYCILNDSPEALNMMQEEHIKVIISLLEKFGRDPKVLDILCKLCVGSGAAVRSSQNNIADFLLPGKNLLLHTAVVDHVAR